MRRPGRGLTSEERAVWAQVARSVTPLRRDPPIDVKPQEAVEAPAAAPPLPPPRKVKGRVPPPLPTKPVSPPAAPPPQLDGSWDKRIAKGALAPDFSLDLHGNGLDAAYQRLIHGLAQAKAMGARVVLVVTGKPRPADPVDRGSARGAIRAKIADWLAASEHASDIVAVRGAHRRHGGSGALYVILRKRR